MNTSKCHYQQIKLLIFSILLSIRCAFNTYFKLIRLFDVVHIFSINQNVVTLPRRNPSSFLRFLALNLLQRLLVPSTSRYSSQISSVSRVWCAGSSGFRSERESPDTKPLSGRDNDVGFEFNCWNQRATFAVEDNCEWKTDWVRNFQWILSFSTSTATEVNNRCNARFVSFVEFDFCPQGM